MQNKDRRCLLAGFKSYAEAIEVAGLEGFTCIIGANGAGKSVMVRSRYCRSHMYVTNEASHLPIHKSNSCGACRSPSPFNKGRQCSGVAGASQWKAHASQSYTAKPRSNGSQLTRYGYTPRLVLTSLHAGALPDKSHLH